MRFWEKNKRLIEGLAAAVLAILAVKFLVINWARDGEEKARVDYENKKRAIDKHRPPGIYDIVDASSHFKTSSTDLDEKIKEIMKQVEIPFHPWIKIPPAYTNDPGAYFVHEWARQRSALDRKCQFNETRLSDRDIGFPEATEGVLDSKGAPENLKRLSIVYRLVELLAEAGIADIVEIVPGHPDKVGPKGHAAIMREYPVSVRVKTGLDPLMKFLHAVRRPGEFFLVVRGLDIRCADPYDTRSVRAAALDASLLSVTITAAGMRFLSEEERKEETERVKPRIIKKTTKPIGA